jgi:hypothetical protein
MQGLFDRIAAGIRTKSAQVLDTFPSVWLGPESKSGVSVTWSKSLEVMAMLACCRVVADGIAQCGVKLMRPRKGGVGADEARDHPLFRLLWRRPNDWQTAYEFWETIVFHMMIVGNAYVFVSRLGDRVIELIVIEPQRVSVTQMPDRTLVYDVIGEDFVQRRFTSAEIWHLRGPSWNGWMGMETIRLARESIGLALSLEASHARMHRNGLQPAGIYSLDGELGVRQVQAARRLDQEAGRRRRSVHPRPGRQVDVDDDVRRRCRASRHPPLPARGHLPRRPRHADHDRPRREDGDLCQRRADVPRPRRPHRDAVGVQDRAVGRGLAPHREGAGRRALHLHRLHRDDAGRLQVAERGP